MDMGLAGGVDIHSRKAGPRGDPLEGTVRGCELGLRKADAELVEVRQAPLF